MEVCWVMNKFREMSKGPVGWVENIGMEKKGGRVLPEFMVKPFDALTLI